MAVVTVTWNGTRIDAADSGSSTANIGGGAGAGAEPDIVYQGSGATPEEISRKIGASAGGFAITPGAATDISTATGTYQTFVMKYNAANSAALETLATPGMQARLGSASGVYAQYDFGGSDAYPEKGGFIFLCADPNITGYHTATVGSPSYTAFDYFGIVGDFTATSKSENLVHSAVDVGDGYTITGGGGADPTAQFSDISAFNSTLANRHGFFFALEGEEGAYGCYGTLQWGSSATAVDHQDNSASTIFFLDGFYAAGWSGIRDSAENASTVIGPSGNTYISRGSTAGATDTRAVYNAVGTNGTPTRTGETFKNFAEFTAAAAFSYVACDIETADFTHATATLTDCTLRCNAASGVATCNDFTPADATNVTFAQSGGGHAIEITSTGTISYTSLFFDGFGADGANDAAIYNNSGGAVTINIAGGGDTPTVRNGTGASTTINNAVTITLNDLVAGSTVYIYNVTDAVELFKVVEPTATFSDAVNYSGDKSLLIRVRNHSGSPYYQDFSATGTLTASGFSLNVNQILDE